MYTSNRSGNGLLILVVGSLVVTVGALLVWAVTSRPWLGGDVPADGKFRPANHPLPVGLDTLSRLSTVALRMRECRTVGARSSRDRQALWRRTGTISDQGRGAAAKCRGIIYVWSPLMPLSRLGIRNAITAAEQLDLGLIVIAGSELYERTRTSRGVSHDESAKGREKSSADTLAAEVAAAGATIHYPAVVVFREGRIIGTAIVGYKTTEAYLGMIKARLHRAEFALSKASDRGASPAAYPVATADPKPQPESTHPFPHRTPAERNRREHSQWRREYQIALTAGPYFRWVPGRSVIAFEADRVVYFLNLRDGTIAVGPGHIDFVPTPDGRLFVTPGKDRTGLQFYYATQVFEAAERGAGVAVEPVYIDGQMKDQYPSVGILQAGDRAGASRTTYRVLTSWYDGAVFRDYEVRLESAHGQPSVRPRGSAIAACPNYELSLPVLAQDGRKLAARDETTATTKIFRLADSGACTELIDLGFQTGKVAWDRDGYRVAFAIPGGAVRARRQQGRKLKGIFVLNLTNAMLTRVPGSETADRLTFPEFVGRDSIMFLISSASHEEKGRSRFRLVCCV